MEPKSPLAIPAATILLAVLAGVPIASVAQPGDATVNEPVLIDGSTTLLPLVREVARRFRLQSSASVEVTGSSSTSGLANLLQGRVHIATASRSIKREEHEAFASSGDAYVELPVALDAIAVIVHPENRWLESVTLDDLRRLLCGEGLETWDQVRPGAPPVAILREVPEEGSGTIDFLLERLEQEGLGRSVRHNENHAAALERVAQEPGAIGVVSFSYAEKSSGRVRALTIDEGDGPIAPVSENLADGTYPLGRPLWIYVRKSVARRPDVQAFVTYLLDQASSVATEIGMAPLPAQFVAAARHRFETLTTGSVMLDGDLSSLIQAYREFEPDS